MYQQAFLDGWLSDEDENLVGGEPESGELLFENGWGESAWQDVADAADTLTPPGSETHHELLTREQEGEIAMALGVAFSRLQAGLGHTRETLDALMEHVCHEEYDAQPEQFDKVTTLYDTLLVYEKLALRNPRFDTEYLQVWQRLCEALQAVAINRDFVLRLADQAVTQKSSRTAVVHCRSEALNQLRQLQQAVFNARNRFVSANIRLVYHVARRHMDKGMALEDMVQEGTLGLMRAAMKFDAGVGVRFSTYAFWWIKQAIRQAIARQRSLIRYPTHVSDQVNRVYGFVQDEIKRTGKKPDAEKIAEATGFSRSKVRDLLALTNLCVSASAPLYDDGDRTLQDDFRYADGYGEPETSASNYQATETLASLLALLSDREAMVLKMKYGIGHRRPYSLNEIAPQVGVSRERVRQIIEESLAKIRTSD